MPILEKTIEAKFVRECKKRDWLCLKQNVIGRRGYPDRLVIRLDGLPVWIELKRAGGVLSENQKECGQELMRHNAYVFVCFDAMEAISIIEGIVI
jgi:hypothetical protein